MNFEGRLARMEAMVVTLEWGAPNCSVLVKDIGGLNHINSFKTLTIDFLRLKNGCDTYSESKPRRVEHQELMSLYITLLRQNALLSSSSAM